MSLMLAVELQVSSSVVTLKSCSPPSNIVALDDAHRLNTTEKPKSLRKDLYLQLPPPFSASVIGARCH